MKGHNVRVLATKVPPELEMRMRLYAKAQGKPLSTVLRHLIERVVLEVGPKEAQQPKTAINPSKVAHRGGLL